MVDEDNTSSASPHAQGIYSVYRKQQQQQKYLLLQRVTSEVPHSSASWPSPAPPLSYHASSLSCTVGPVKCLDVVQGGYHGGGCASLEPLTSGSASASASLPLDAVASGACAATAVAEGAALGSVNGLSRKRKCDDICEGDSGIRIQSRVQKTSRIEAIINASGSAVCKETASVAKDTTLQKDCHTGQLEAEEALSNGFSNTSSILPHSKNARSVPPSELLEGILDNLQKKDKYGVFSEPVDAIEVPGYYDIIREPMDFGTIRNKLSKGEYLSLDLFKKDVYLICSNAMHFNGPKTIYFKQARSIQVAAHKAMNSLAIHMSGLDDYSKLTNKRKANGAKKIWKSLSNYNSKVQQTNIDDRSHSVPAFSKETAYKNGAIMLKNSAYDEKLGKSWEESMGAEDTHAPQFQCGGREKEGPIFEYGTSVKGRKWSSAYEDCRSSYQPSVCRDTDSEDLPQLFPMTCLQEHAYAQSLAYFGANFKSAARKLVARKIQNILAPQLPFIQGSVVRKDPAAAATLLEDVELLKMQSRGLGGIPTGIPEGPSIRNKIHVSSLPYTTDAVCTYESTTFPRCTELSSAGSIATEASQVTSLLPMADPQSQGAGKNIKAQFISSSQPLIQSACEASLDTSNFYSTRPYEYYQGVNSFTAGVRQQGGRNSTGGVSFEASNKKVMDSISQSSRLLKNASLDTTTVLPTRLMENYGAEAFCTIKNRHPEGRTPMAENHEENNMQRVYCTNQSFITSESASFSNERGSHTQREDAFAQPLHAQIIHSIGSEQMRGSFDVEQWNPLSREANAALDHLAPAVVLSGAKNAGNEVQRVPNWNPMLILGRNLSADSEFYDRRVTDVCQPHQNPLWNLEPYTETQKKLYICPEKTHLQAEPQHFSDCFSISDPRKLESCLSNSNLLAAHRQFQSVSGSLCHPWQSLASQKSLGQIVIPFMVSDTLTPGIQFPVAQGLTGITSQQPNLALQL